MNEPETFTCRVCHETKPLSDFPTHPKAKSGHSSVCRCCYGARISAGRAVRNLLPPPPPPALQPRNPKFEGLVPRQLIAEMKELIAELRARGYSYRGELTYLQRIKL